MHLKSTQPNILIRQRVCQSKFGKVVGSITPHSSRMSILILMAERAEHLSLSFNTCQPAVFFCCCYFPLSLSRKDKKSYALSLADFLAYVGFVCFLKQEGECFTEYYSVKIYIFFFVCFVVQLHLYISIILQCNIIT